jgi:prevent-host-death family protein
MRVLLKPYFPDSRLTNDNWFIKLVYMKPKNTTVGSFEAKTHLARLLDEVAAGGAVTITRRGRPVARMIAISEHGTASRADAVEKLAQIRAGIPGGASIRELIREGRKR